jgi:hypothetical protein
MQDMQEYLEKLHRVAVDCAYSPTISDAGIRAGTCDQGERTLVAYFASPR